MSLSDAQAKAALFGTGVGVGLLLARSGLFSLPRSAPPSSSLSKAAAVAPAADAAAALAARLPLSAPAMDMDTAGGSLRALRKAETVIQRRTDQIILVVERCTATHNYTAVIRTAEAMGIQHVWLISPPRKDGVNPKQNRRKNRWEQDAKELTDHIAYARMACKWITVREFRTTAECVTALREEGRDIWVTDLGQQAEALETGSRSSSGSSSTHATAPPLRPALTLPRRMAIVFGTESTGCSDEILAAADRRVYLPLHGFADSLNLSVAAAMVLQALFFLCPGAVGNMAPEAKAALRAEWYPKLARTPEQLTEYTARIANPPPPYDDLRRPDEHRGGWQPKKVKRKNNEAWGVVEKRVDLSTVDVDSNSSSDNGSDD